MLNEEGEVEMDAMIMDGSDLSIGAVAGVSSVANPVHLALAVKERTPHAMLIGSGAEKFARSIPHIKCVSPNSLIQPEAIEELKKFKQYKVIDVLAPTSNLFFLLPLPPLSFILIDFTLHNTNGQMVFFRKRYPVCFLMILWVLVQLINMEMLHLQHQPVGLLQR